MNPSQYIHWPGGVWHVFITWTRNSSIRVRCGRTLDPGRALNISPTVDLPVNEKACKRCVTLVLNDQEPTETEDDEAPA